MSITKLRAETFEESNLFIGELNPTPLDMLLQAQKPLMFGQQLMTAPNTTHATRADVNVLEGQLLSDPRATLGGLVQTMVEDGFLNLFTDPVGVRAEVVPGIRTVC